MSDNNRDVLTAFLFGGTLGAIAGLLLAPRPGRETRKRLHRWLDEIEERGEDYIEKGRDLYEEGKEYVNDKAKKVRRSPHEIN